MSHRVKNLTIEDGFVKNPDKVYYEEYFNELPHHIKDFVLTSSGKTNFTIYQPANTFLKEVYVICKTAPTITDGNVGISISHTAVEDVGSGTIVIGTATNIINDYITMTANSVAKVFPGNELTPPANNLSTSVSYSASRRLLYCRVTTTTAASALGNFTLAPVFGHMEKGIHHFNQNYILSGAGTPNVEYDCSSGYSGVKLTTSTTASGQAIIHPNSTEHNALSSGVLRPAGRIEFETSVILPSIAADFSFVAGLKLTSTPLITTDANQAMFIFGQDEPLVASADLSSNTNILFVYSVGETDYVTDTGLAVVAHQEYHLKISINKQKKISIFINGIQYGLTTTVYSSGNYGSTATNSYDESVAMSNVSLYPVVGMQNSDSNTTASSVVVNYIKCSRDSKKVSN
tara:strand:+ start:42 stop:1250 length:1209 start_codon:yes stop_codon:yes gene_type:complete